MVEGVASGAIAGLLIDVTEALLSTDGVCVEEAIDVVDVVGATDMLDEEDFTLGGGGGGGGRGGPDGGEDWAGGGGGGGGGGCRSGGLEGTATGGIGGC